MNGENKARKAMTRLLIIMLALSSIVGFMGLTMPGALAYTTPDTGVVWHGLSEQEKAKWFQAFHEKGLEIQIMEDERRN